MNVPIISLEVQAMKHTIRTALSEHAAKVDSGIQAAVESYCTEANINAVVRVAAMDALNAAVKEEVRNFFSYSKAGRTAVREAVHAYLNEIYSTDGDK